MRPGAGHLLATRASDSLKDEFSRQATENEKISRPNFKRGASTGKLQKTLRETLEAS